VGDLMITAKVDLIDRDIVLGLSQDLSPAGRSAAIAAFAQDQLAAAEATDAGVLGEVPDHTTFVDGSENDDLKSVRPDGVIVFDFDVLTLIVRWIEQQLVTHSPFRTGRYQRSHRVYVDGSEINTSGRISGSVQEVVFAPLVAYARRIEQGWSKQTPDGVYQVIAALARSKFLASAVSVSFGYRSIAGVEETGPERRARPHAPRDLRQPAIILQVK
jgi:hypothetical protein